MSARRLRVERRDLVFQAIKLDRDTHQAHESLDREEAWRGRILSDAAPEQAPVFPIVPPQGRVGFVPVLPGSH